MICYDLVGLIQLSAMRLDAFNETLLMTRSDRDYPTFLFKVSAAHTSAAENYLKSA